MMSSDEQATVLSQVFARVESRFNHFRTVIHDPSARIAAIYAIEDEIDEQLEVVDAARQLIHSQLARRNTLVPISALPPEILARVFQFLVLNDHHWIRATHVCQFWRQVALDDSSLWTKISSISYSTEWTLEMLVRAKNAPLDINISLRSSSGRELLHMIPPHFSHTRKLRLYGLSSTTLRSNDIQCIHSLEAPVLEHFELRGSGISPIITFRELEGTALFKGRAPRLRTFSLSQVVIPWSLIPRGQLTQLTIRLIEESPTPYALSYGDLSQLIDFLVNSSELEILVLERCLPFQLAEISYGQTVHLPRLSRLCLGGSSSRITNLMKMLKIPSSTRLHLHCISENTPIYNDSLLLSVVAAQFQVLAPVKFKSLSVTISSTTNLLRVSASTILPSCRSFELKDFEGSADDKSEFVLSFVGLPELGYCIDHLGQVCKMLPISDLELLFISASDTLDSLNWVGLFERCAKVTTMQAIGKGTIGLVRALTTSKLTSMTADMDGKKRKQDEGDSTPASSTAVPAETPIFPKLSYLSLRKLDFSEYEHLSGILFDVVERGLQQRMAGSKEPLGMLRIENCVINDRYAGALQKLVQEFHWDGKEDFLDSDSDWTE